MAVQPGRLGMTDTDLPTTAAGALLRRLHHAGIDVVFLNSGTDFPPIIEALSEAHAHGVTMPRMILVPHEHIAMGMAQGHHLATDSAQAVMLHTNVGLANAAIGAINAATDHVPVMMMSGRTPIVEKGRFGARTVPIGWGQEMRDQAALVREACKWDYELRFGEQTPDLVDRAIAIADSTPRGPVYLSLPRETLSEPCPVDAVRAPTAMQPAIVEARPSLIEEAADALASAERPLIIAQRGAGSQFGFDALADMADVWALPVCQYWAVALGVSASHPSYVGQDPSPWIDTADVILVIDSLAPWSPDIHDLPDSCRVIHMGPDPLYSRFPVRNFRSDITIQSETGPGLVALHRALEARDRTGDDVARIIDERRSRIAAWNARRTALRAESIQAGSGSPMSKDWVSHCLGEAIRGIRTTVLSELGCPLDPIGLTDHGSWRQEPHSGGLGWSFPCAMGLKLGDPDRLVVATMGDGSYLFANPVACHQVASSAEIPVLVIVLNNGSYGAVEKSVLEQHPVGYAAKADDVPLTGIPFEGSFAAVAAACGAHAESVNDGTDLPAALSRAIDVAMVERRQAFLEVMIT